MSTYSSSGSSDRRRQWLISRGLLSPSGPSRRLGALIPSTRRARSAEVDVRLESHNTPVLIARASADRQRAPRAVSMPSEDPVASGPNLARAASSRVEYGDRNTSPPRRRFRMRRQRKKSRDDPRSRSRITVVDRELPRTVLTRRDPTFDGQEWNEYRGKIDQLAEDEGFMEYLTAPVQTRDVIEEDTDAQQLAVNKLYPLAFIRLLEAHARYANEREVVDPEDEAHRYDDLDGEDEHRVQRMASSGIHDMGRFRTVGSVKSSESRTDMDGQQHQMTRLIKDRPARQSEEKRRLYQSFRFRLSKENRTDSVPVY